jgi:hypothetical protein
LYFEPGQQLPVQPALVGGYKCTVSSFLMSEGGQSVAERGVPVRGEEDDPGTITTNDLREEGLRCVHIRYLNIEFNMQS